MPEPVTVWMVHLGRGTVSEVEGTLSLDAEALVFAHGGQPVELRFPFARIARVRRVLGSPVLLVDWRDGELPRRTAFYFSKPPPLEPPDASTRTTPSGRALGPLGQLRAGSRRRHRRASVGYLAAHGGRTKPVLRAWVRELRERIARAEGQASTDA